MKKICIQERQQLQGFPLPKRPVIRTPGTRISSRELDEAYLTGAGADLLGLAAAGAAVVEDTGVLGVRADVLEGGGVAELGVDADDVTAVAGGDALHVDVALALGLALFGSKYFLAV